MDSNGDTSDDLCFVNGRHSPYDEAWSLLDSSDPSAGVVLTYTGDYCAVTDSQRLTELIFECADLPLPRPTTAFEPETCHYQITIPSWYGCPQECPVSGRHLCAGNGHCKYDTDEEKSRCFCDKA